MKVKVKIGFKDKHTKKRYKAGEVIEVDEKRLEEIKSVKNGKLIEVINEETESENPEAESQGTKTTRKKAAQK